MTKSLSNTLTLVLASIGSVLALLLSLEYYFADKITLPCSSHGAGCQGTLASDYAHLGPIPTAAFGLGMYLLLVWLCVRRKQLLQADRSAEEERARAYASAETAALSNSDATAGAGGDSVPPTSAFPSGAGFANPADSAASTPLRLQIRQIDTFVWGLALLGVGISWWLQYTSIWAIHSFCPYCFTSALLITAIFALASRDHLLDGRSMTGEQKLLVVVLGFVLILMGFIFVPDAIVNLHQQPPSMPTSPSMRSVLIKPNMHVKGDPKAKYTLVEFADYCCPHCQKTNEELPTLLHDHPDVKLVYRNYPLLWPQTKFPHSGEASEAAEAAALQGKFWEMHDYIFEHQTEMESATFTIANFDAMAETVGLDVQKFKHDIMSDALKQRIETDVEDGERANVESTPTLFLITPDNITQITTLEELRKIMTNPKDPAWK